LIPQTYKVTYKVTSPVNDLIILPVVLHGCETWSLTLREERRLRVFEKRVLRNVFGSQECEVTGEWRRLHYQEL
jgi:hypothetical protein